MRPREREGQLFHQCRTCRTTVEINKEEMGAKRTERKKESEAKKNKKTNKKKKPKRNKKDREKDPKFTCNRSLVVSKSMPL